MSLPSDTPDPGTYDLAVAGGGAAGFFGAIACAESCQGARVILLEKSGSVLGKVKISGGGRCNLTHACFEPRKLVANYPRGSRQLIGPFSRWGPGDTMAWFEERGVPLKVEDDGRVFPASDDSQSIIDCLTRAARAAGVTIRTKAAVRTVTERAGRGFELGLDGGETLCARHLLLTLGGTRNQIGADLAARLGHRVEPAAPSLFTFKIDDQRLAGLQGVSVPSATVRIAALGLETTGAVLVTHWGLSGPAVLRASAWGARALQALDYRFEVTLDWTGGLGAGEILARFNQCRLDAPRRRVANDPQFGIPARLWSRLVGSVAAEVGSATDDLRWPHLALATARRLAQEAGAGRFLVAGKSMNKDEFVTCGGVSLAEVDFKFMASRRVADLYFAGEILDIDGITGGFNFQSAWTTGHIAGEAVARSIGGG